MGSTPTGHPLAPSPGDNHHHPLDPRPITWSSSSPKSAPPKSSSSKSLSSEIANHLVFSEVGEELVHLIYTNPESRHQKIVFNCWMLRATGSLEKVLSKLLDLALITGACTQYSENYVSMTGLQRGFKQAPF